MNAIDLPKPKLSPEACRLFYEIVAYVRRYFVDGNRKWLPNAASDVMDGLCYSSDPEVKELKRKHLIRPVYIGDGGWNRGWTWELTPYGCEAVSRQIFVPDYCI